MITKAFWTGFLLVLPFSAGALGLGGISVDSFLDQPLNAQIELITPVRVEADDIRVSLAPPAAFEKMGLERPFQLSQLRFSLEAGEDGRILVKLASRQAVREPYLNFLVELSWSGGRLLKEYTILLDPPHYQPPVNAVVEAPGNSLSETVGQASRQGRPETYGPVRRSETLWVIARNTRPDRSISVEQMMMALQRRNPAAFRHGNVNLLDQGAVLEIPGREFITALSAGEARNQFIQQTRDWRSGRKHAPASRGPTNAPLQEPKGASRDVRQQPSPIQPEAGRILQEVDKARVESESPGDGRGDQLSVVEPARQWAIGDQTAAYSYPSDDEDKLREAIADSKQDVLAVREINRDLEKLQNALASQIQALRQSLEEKDKNISRLRQRLAATEVQPESAAKGGGIETTRNADPESTSKGSATRVPKIAGMEPIPPLRAPEPAVPPQLRVVFNWAQANWILLLLIAVFLLLMMMWVRRKQPTAAGHQEVNSFRSYTELNQDLPMGVTSEQIPDSFRSYTDEQGLFTEVGEDTASILTKADIYLAYRQYDQAVSLVIESIAENPGSCVLQAKLLEIYAFRKDQPGFVHFLGEVYDSMSRKEPAIWAKVVAMGRDLVPDHPLIRASHLPGEPGPDSSVDELLALERTFASSVVTPDEGLHDENLSLLEIESDLHGRSSGS